MYDLTSELVGIHNGLTEITHAGLVTKQSDIEKLFPTFKQRVKAVGDKGGIRLVSTDKDLWNMKIHSGTEDNKWYEFKVEWHELGDKIKDAVTSKSILKKDKSGIDQRKLARKLLKEENIRILCTCPAFQYWGPAYILSKDKYDGKYGRKETRPPKERNPNEYGATCKHGQAFLRTLPFYATDMIKFLKEHWAKEIKAAEDSLKPEDTKVKVDKKDDVKDDKKKSPISTKKFDDAAKKRKDKRAKRKTFVKNIPKIDKEDEPDAKESVSITINKAYPTPNNNKENNMNEMTTMSSIAYLPGGGSDIKTILKNMAGKQPDWDIDILENDDGYDVNLGDVNIKVGKDHWKEFSSSFLSNVVDKKINLSNFLESKHMSYRKTLLEATDLTIYKKLIRVLGSYSSKFPSTGIDKLFTQACEIGKKIMPTDARAMAIIEELLDNDSIPAIVQKMQNTRFVNLNYMLKPTIKNGRKKETAFWCVDDKVGDKIIDLIDFNGVGKKGFWCDVTGAKATLVEKDEPIEEASIVNKIKKALNDIADDYGDKKYDKKDLKKGLKGYLNKKELADNKEEIAVMIKKYV